MKNLTKIFMAVVAGMFAFSCVTDTTEDLGIEVGKGGGKTQITVSLEESRTQLGDRDDDGKYPLYWSAGDQIAINGEASAALAEGGNAAATFSFEKVLTTPYNIVYPASEGANVVNFLAEQPYTVGTFAPKAAPMYGYATTADKAIELNHLTGVLRLAVKGNGEAITSVVFTSELGKIAGPFTVDCTNGTLTAQEGASNTVTVTFAEPLVLGAEATPIYATVPAGNYGNFAITLHTATDKMTVKFNSATKPIAVGMVREFKEFTYQANDVEAGGTVFEIDSKDALIEFAGLVAAGTFGETYTAAAVVADIDMTGYDWAPIEGFNGFTFDGGKASGYAINGLTAPLFGSTNSTIQNVDLTNVNIASNGRLVLGAVVCNLAAEGSLANCHTSGTITVSNPEATIAEDADLYTTVNYGGLVGISGGKIDGCVNEAKIQVSQLASANNTTAVKPGIGGVVALVTNGGVITNCVNGNTEKTTGIINYHDNCATKLYTPHIGGIAGYVATATISNSTNYGALDFNAKAGGTYKLDKTSTIAGGILGYSEYTTHEGNNNYGTLTVSGGDIMTLIAGGFAGYVAQPAKCYNNHNKQGGNVTIEASLVFQSLNVAGVAGAMNGKPMEACTNDAPIVAKASTSTEAVPDGSAYYRVAGITTYTGADGYVLNCENKANGDITVSGNVILLRNDAQACAAVVGGVAYYAKAAGKVDGIINRGDINVYANFYMHEKLTDPTHGKLTIAGSVGYITGAEYNIENHGNITIGKKDVEQTITANGICIGGATAWNTRAYDTATNKGIITIANKVTLASKYTNVDEADKNVVHRTFIGGIIGYSGGGAFSNFNNSGALTINCTMNAITYIGGISGYKAASTSTSFTNGGNIAINGTIADEAYIGGIGGYVTSALDGCDNTGNVTVAGKTDGLAYIGGIGGYVTSTLDGCDNTGNVTVSAAIGNSPHIGGGVGYATGNITSGSNSGTISVSSTITTGTSYVGGYVGQCNGGTEFSEISNTGDVTFSGNSGNNTLALGGAVGSVSIAGAFSNCSNNGVVTLTKEAKANKVHYVGGLIGYSVASSSYTSCTNSTKTGVEWGIVIHQTSSTTGGSSAKRIGGLIGNASTTTLKDVSNSAGIYHDGYQLGTAGLSIGGIGGTMGTTTVSGVIENSGNIYYAGRCPKSNFGIAGIFATPGSSSVLTNATITNTGNITIEKKFDDFIPTDNGSHKCVCGGITGYAPKQLDNATSYCTISILNWRADSGTAANNNFFGLIQGINTPTNHITNCKVGGTLELTTGIIEDEYNQTTEEVNLPGTLTVANYAMYITGDQTFTSATAKTQKIGLITSADDATPEYAE